MAEVSHDRDLRVWQGAMELVEMAYRLSADFPQHEMCGLAAQIRRAAVPVPSNIAEGHSRASRQEYLHHLSIARGSLAELETQLEIAARLGDVSRQNLDVALSEASAVGRQLYALRNSLRRMG